MHFSNESKPTHGSSTAITSLLSRYGYSFLDQFLFAGTNFLVTFLLARYLSKEVYGSFTTIYTVFLFFGTIHTAIIGEPLVIYGARKNSNEITNYLSSYFYIQLALSIIISIVLLIITCIFRNKFQSSISGNLFGVVFTLPFILSQWFIRRAFYSTFSQKLAAYGSFLYLLIIATCFFILILLDFINPIMIWISMGTAGYIVTVISLVKLNITKCKIRKEDFQQVFHDIMQFSGLNLASTGIFWLSGQFIYFLIPITLGLTASAQINAALNFYRPINPIIQSINIMLMPSMSRYYSTEGATTRKFPVRVLYVLAIIIFSIACYGLLITIFFPIITEIAYNSKYSEIRYLIPLFSVTYIASTIVSFITIYFKTIGEVKQTVYIWSISAISTILFFFPLTRYYNLLGSIYTLIISYCIAAIVSLVIYQIVVRQKLIESGS